MLALAFLVLVGVTLIAESLDLEISHRLFVFRDGLLRGRGMDQHTAAATRRILRSALFGELAVTA